MSQDVLSDAVVETMADVAHAAANDALSGTLGEDAIATVWTWPVSEPSQVGENALPCLAVSRLIDTEEEQTLFDQIERTTIRIAYIASATPSDKLNERWPLLRAVFNNVIRALREAVYPQFGVGQGELKDAGVTAYILGSVRVQYRLIPGVDTKHPSFEATAVFQTTGEDLFQRDDLDRLETNAAEFSEPDALEATEPVAATIEYDWSE